MVRKRYKSAPLPFTGQKRMFLQHFEHILNENITNDGEDWTIVDVFGGSGLLAHNAKWLKPKARVIYNDFDGYVERLKNINDINQLRQKIAVILGDYPKGKCITPDIKTRIIAEIEQFQGYKNTHILCSWLCFSGTQVANLDELKNERFYHCLRQSDYPSADGYLDGLEVVSQSFEELIPQFADNSKTLLLLDPPYLCTKQESYKQANYVDLIAFLKLIDLVKPPYLFFSSTKSEFVRFIEYLQESKAKNWQTFANAKRITTHATVSYNAEYEDNLVYKFYRKEVLHE